MDLHTQNSVTKRAADKNDKKGKSKPPPTETPSSTLENINDEILPEIRKASEKSKREEGSPPVAKEKKAKLNSVETDDKSDNDSINDSNESDSEIDTAYAEIAPNSTADTLGGT